MTMPASVVGMFAALLIALTGAVGGLGWCLVAVLLATVGYLVGAHLDRRIDLASLLPGRGRG
jgi:hypothetical protein